MSTTPNRPTHRAYFIVGEGDNARWHELGPVWSHKDGEGFSLLAHVLPAPGQNITIRKIKPKDAAPTVNPTETPAGSYQHVEMDL
jgi:hypothetical protein